MNILQRAISGRSTEFYLSFALLWLLPALVLAVLGATYLWQAGWFWWFSLGLLVLTLLTWLISYLATENEQQEADAVFHLDPLPDWSEHDNEIWRKSLQHLESSELAATPWQDIPEAMHDQLAFVASLYREDEPNAKYAFSLPELLLMLEIWSRNYRGFLMEHVPLSRDLKISTIQNVSRKSEAISRAYKLAHPVITVARTLLNPASGVAAEIRSQLMSQAMGDISDHMQHNLKQVLFEQVSQVAIDLYSGRLKLSDQELSAYRQSQQPEQEEVMAPLSVMLLGQVNAGKSSLLNALKEQCLAEVDVLPATQRFHFHHMQLAEGLESYLIDTPGLDGNSRVSSAILKQALKADLVLWLSQSNQPAKALDKQFYQQWVDYFEQHKSRKMPPIILVSTHNDLLPPAGQWQPPYDMTEQNNKKVGSMLGALKYTHETIGLPSDCPAVPLCLAPEQPPYNLDVLWDLLLSVSDEARAAQLNKERLQPVDRSSIISRGLKQSAGLIKMGVNLAVK